MDNLLVLNRPSESLLVESMAGRHITLRLQCGDARTSVRGVVTAIITTSDSVGFSLLCKSRQNEGGTDIYDVIFPEGSDNGLCTPVVRNKI